VKGRRHDFSFIFPPAEADIPRFGRGVLAPRCKVVPFSCFCAKEADCSSAFFLSSYPTPFFRPPKRSGVSFVFFSLTVASLWLP